MSRVLLVCPTHRDRRELEWLGETRRHEFVSFDYASIELEDLTARGVPRPTIGTPRGVIEQVLAGPRPDAVLSVDDYPGSSLASILARHWNLPGASPRAVMLCQHKFHSRLAQREVAAEAVPRFALVDARERPAPPLPFPFFVKPVKSFFSVGAARVEGAGDWPRALDGASLPEAFFSPFNDLMRGYAGLEPGAGTVLAEELLEGEQVTVEGWSHDGRARALGVVDSVMFPGTHSFKRFDYPSRLADGVQARMEAIACRVMDGLGFECGLFNIEMMYDARRDRVSIIEINPRMSSQFADLFEKVDGVNSYSVALSLALGREPAVRRRAGRHARAASCVLRVFEDRLVAKLPSSAEVTSVLRQIPDARVELLATEGLRLSQQMQDASSFRYGLINLGGRDERDIEEQLAACLSKLTFELNPFGS